MAWDITHSRLVEEAPTATRSRAMRVLVKVEGSKEECRAEWASRRRERRPMSRGTPSPKRTAEGCAFEPARESCVRRRRSAPKK
jgi:hypothetical protein